MRVLFVSNNFPTDLRVKIHGIYKRMGLFIDAIKGLASIDFLYYVSPSFDISQANVAKLEQEFAQHWQADITLTLCHRSTRKHQFLRRPNYLPGALNFFEQKPYISLSGKRQVAALEDCLDRKPDAIFAHRLQAMCPLMLAKAKLPPIFFDLDDIEHISLDRQLKQPAPYRKKDRSYHLYLPSLRHAELKAIRKAQKTFICSEQDRTYLAEQLKLPGIVTIPNAITMPMPHPLTNAPTLLFIGSYTYQPNVTAAEFLIEQVWPHVHQVMPESKLIIAGAHPESIRGHQIPPPGVEFTGFVENLDELYQKVRVVCCPILSGSGTRVKLIEAAAYRKPIVSTRIGAEGLDLVDGEAIFLRDHAKTFADACIELLQNDQLCQRLGNAAYTVASKRYDRAQILQQIQHHL
ncbi:glycosyltransferase [Leptothoe spongobia]|uniref:Glycosyltransferase family 4 protein n=1 Tax=Leptothoe spongobia TAU-MAC 1115 TaxID=1967444 RepID=A0A947DD94_9CYAN|nr:glycosyltransferase [Leptothoe spongobia]MBT9314745.1 glycosyltransferase family 4 protein [Leptothoe spongobia TAU-MAC 1115]